MSTKIHSDDLAVIMIFSFIISVGISFLYGLPYGFILFGSIGVIVFGINIALAIKKEKF